MSHPDKDQWDKHIEFARRLLDTLQDDGYALFRRDEHAATADGYPSSSMGGDGRGGGDSSSTETAALADVRYDSVHDDAINCRSNVDDAINALLRAVRNTQHAAKKGKHNPEEHGPAGVCLACYRDVTGTPIDRLRSGYCPTCYRAWLRAGKPDRFRFERERRQQPAA